MLGSEYVIKYISDLTEATAGAKEVERVNADMSKTLTMDFQRATRVIGTSLDKISEKPITFKGEKGIQTITQLGTVIQTADGSFKGFTKTQTAFNGEVYKTAGSLKDVTSQFGKTNIETAKSQKNFLTMGENMKRLASRALLTIPVWMALRAVMQGTFRTIRDGFKTIVDQDKALQKAKRTLQGTTSSIESDFKRLREEVTKLSIETGESVEKITNAFYKFSTVGFDFETSMKGAEYATKTAIVMFGDAEETANAFSRSMRVLVDRSKDAKPAGEQIAEAMALTSELWKSNAFELNEFTQSLEKFAGTAKATNFTTQQTISLLASLSTGGLRGSRAGRLLRTSVVKLLTNLDKLASTLGVKVNPEMDSTYDVFMRVLTAVNGLDEGSKVAKQTAEVIGDLFGGVRGMEAVLALKALRQEMLKNSQVIGNVMQLDKSYKDVNETINRQVEQFHNLNKEIGKAFIVGVTGGDDFADSLEKINTKLKKLQTIADNIGQLFTFGYSGELDKETNIIIKTLDKLGQAISPISRTFVRKIDNMYNEAVQKTIEGSQKINEALTGKLNKEELENLLSSIKLGEIQIDDNIIKRKVIDRLENIISGESIKPKIDIETDIIDDEEKEKRRLLQTKEEQNVANLVLGIELDRLRTLGATNSQLLKAEKLYIKQLDIEEDSLNKTKRKLEYEKAINEEKRLQNKLGSTSLKLFDIAQTEGVDMARQISDVLAGGVDFDIFVRQGGEALDIFKKEFADVFKQQQAISFFKGERVPEMPELFGGETIEIEEEAIRGITNSLGRVILEFSKAQQAFARFEQPDKMEIIRPNKVEIIGVTGLEGAKSETITNIKNPFELPISFTKEPTEKLTKKELERQEIRNISTLSPIEQKTNINFASGSFVVHGSSEEQDIVIGKALEEYGRKIATRGTKENEQINKAIEQY